MNGSEIERDFDIISVNLQSPEPDIPELVAAARRLTEMLSPVHAPELLLHAAHALALGCDMSTADDHGERRRTALLDGYHSIVHSIQKCEENSLSAPFDETLARAHSRAADIARELGLDFDGSFLNEAVTHLRRTVSLLPPSDSKRNQRLLSLADCLRRRQFSGFDSSADEDEALRILHDVRTSPGLDHLTWVQAVLEEAEALLDRATAPRSELIDEAYELLSGAVGSISRAQEPEYWARAHHDMADALMRSSTGDSADNLERAIELLELCLQVLDPVRNKRDWTVVKETLGFAYTDRIIGDTRENVDTGIRHIEEALSVVSASTDRNSWGRISRNLAIAYTARRDRGVPGDPERIRELLEASHDVRPRNRNPRQWALTIETAAASLLQEPDNLSPEQFLAALADFERAGEVYLEQQDTAARVTNLTLRITAHEQVQQRSDLSGDEAEQLTALLSELLELCNPNVEAGMVTDAARKLGDLLARDQRWPEAVQAFRQGLDAATLLLSAASTHAASKPVRTAVDSLTSRLAYCLGRVGLLAEAVTVLERNRARILASELGGHPTQLIELTRRDPLLADAYTNAATRLHEALASDPTRPALRARRYSRKADTGPGREEIHDAAKKIELLRHELKVVTGKVRQLPGFADFLAEPSLAMILDVATASTPLVYVVTSEWGSLSLLVLGGTEDKPDIRVTWSDDFAERDLTHILMRPAKPNSESIIKFGGYILRLAAMYHTRYPNGDEAMTDGLALGPGVSHRGPREESGDMALLGSRLSAKIGSELHRVGAREAVLILCGRLGNFPVHSAPYDNGPRPSCLMEELDISFTPSAEALGHARKRAIHRHEQASHLVGIANPLPHPSPLLFAEEEVRRISGYFNVAEVFIGTEATIDRLRSAVVDATYVHLACHGSYYLGDRSPRLRFADGAELSVDEIRRLGIFSMCRLVNLSACQTAVISFEEPMDEAVGLPSGVLASGAAAVIASLWPVDDLSTSLVMERFYQLHLQGVGGEDPMPPIRALCAAQRWLSQVTARELIQMFQDRLEELHSLLATPRRSRAPGAATLQGLLRFEELNDDDRPFVDPYFWGSFILIGE